LTVGIERQHDYRGKGFGKKLQPPIFPHYSNLIISSKDSYACILSENLIYL